MQIAVLATDEQWKELTEDCDATLLTRVNSIQENADAYIILNSAAVESARHIQKPIIINAVIQLPGELKVMSNIVRINGWGSFLKRKKWEVAGIICDEIKQVFSVLNKEYITVADEPGLLAARPVSLIINEAYFALGEGVSTKEEIDTAMKLGTNYPMGPFEWAAAIGVENINQLLLALAKKDKKYSPAPLLQKEAAA